MSAATAMASHAGRRKYNQDRLVAQGLSVGGETFRLLAVFDGMGGMRAGDRAAQLASDVFTRYLTDQLAAARVEEPLLREALGDAVRRAHDVVFQEGQVELEKRGMGTTLTAVLERDGRFLVVNVGDSRAYLWSPNDGLQRLTRDHSVREEGVRLGKLTEEEAKASPYAHALTRAVGSGAPPEADIFPEPDGWFALPAGGALLLCSDGLTAGLADENIDAIVSGSANADAMTDRLLRGAFHGGSNDNISVVVLLDGAFQPTAPAPPPLPPIEVVGTAVKPPPPEVAPPPAPHVDQAAWVWPKVLLMAAALLAIMYLVYRFSTPPPPLPPAPPAASSLLPAPSPPPDIHIPVDLVPAPPPPAAPVAAPSSADPAPANP